MYYSLLWLQLLTGSNLGLISVIRLLYNKSNNSDLSSEQTKLLAKLRKITVIDVQSITTTLSLDTCRETTPEDVSFKETDDKFTVFVSRTRSPGKSKDALICWALSGHIEVDMMMLFTSITHPVEVVNYLFEMSKIPEIPVDDGHDRSWLQAIIQPNLPIIPTPIVTEKSLSPVPPASSPPRSPTALSVHDEEHFPPLGAKPTRNLRHAPSPSPSASYFPASIIERKTETASRWLMVPFWGVSKVFPVHTIATDIIQLRAVAACGAGECHPRHE